MSRLINKESNTCLSKVETFALDGLDLFFNSNDHLPQHFHVRKPGQWEIRVFFRRCSQQKGLDFVIKWSANSGPSSKEKHKILKLVLENRSALLMEWQKKVCVKENQ
jgi:hypothetical protein